MSEKKVVDRHIAVLCDATEEWAEVLDSRADDLANMGSEGRAAAKKVRAEAESLRVTVLHFRELRQRNPETDEWEEA